MVWRIYSLHLDHNFSEVFYILRSYNYVYSRLLFLDHGTPHPRLHGFHDAPGAICTGEIAGLESANQDVCCVEECGKCGGPGCNPGGNSTLTANDCCVTEIVESNVFCDVSGAAPCILTGKSESMVQSRLVSWN